ncbi:hypothetical protein ACIHFE_00765 [Streptomyces sp. NPDC052396]
MPLPLTAADALFVPRPQGDTDGHMAGMTDDSINQDRPLYVPQNV